MDWFFIIARIRRTMPRNVDVMAVCDELEARLMAPAPEPKVVERIVEKLVEPPSKPKFDKRAYQRDLMRKRRAKSSPGEITLNSR